MHATDEVEHGALILDKNQWDYELIKCLGFQKLTFPDVDADMAAIGVNATAYCPVCTAFDDQQAALLWPDLRLIKWHST